MFSHGAPVSETLTHIQAERFRPVVSKHAAVGLSPNLDRRISNQKANEKSQNDYTDEDPTQLHLYCDS